VRGADSRVGVLTVDCNTRIHEGALQSEAPLSAQRWYASGAVFMLLRKAKKRQREGVGCAQDAIFCIEIAPERAVAGFPSYMHSQFRRGPRLSNPSRENNKPKATIVRGLRQCAGTTASKQGAQGVSCRSGCRFLPYALGRDDRIMMMIVELIVES
jgi:hypothetical protein